jgi:hypothetical protein
MQLTPAKQTASRSCTDTYRYQLMTLEPNLYNIGLGLPRGWVKTLQLWRREDGGIEANGDLSCLMPASFITGRQCLVNMPQHAVT